MTPLAQNGFGVCSARQPRDHGNVYSFGFGRMIHKCHYTFWIPIVLMVVTTSGGLSAQETTANETASTVLDVANALAQTPSGMKPYAELIEHTDLKIELVPIPGGTLNMGSPPNEAERSEDEGPQHIVELSPFWMSKFEITWEIYEAWMFDLDIQRRKYKKVEANARDIAADEFQLSQPTKPYTDMTFGMGRQGYPAICMTQLSTRIFCKWLSAKTGRYYRLPTEAEWEYACRASTDTAYYFGNDPAQLDDYAWHYENSDDTYHKVGQKKPNPWGLYDMHGNVSEWVLDQFSTDFYAKSTGATSKNPLAMPQTLYPRVVRGGSWDDDPDRLRSAARDQSSPDWKQQDPQIPKSIWYHTDAVHVGFRIVRPFLVPSPKEQKVKWDRSLPVQDRKAGR